MNRTKAALVIVPLVLVAGCGVFLPPFSDGTLSPTVTIDPNDKPTAYLIGELEGVIADEIQDMVDLVAHTGTEADGAIVIAGSAVDGLDDTQKAAVKAAFNAHQPIAVVHVAEPQIEALLGILGEADTDVELPDGVLYAEVYAIDKEAGGDTWTSTWHPPSTTYTQTLETIETNLIGTTTTTESEPVRLEDTYDSDYNQDTRMLSFMQWLSGNGTRSDSELAQASKRWALAQAANSNNLTELAAAWIDEKRFQQAGNNYTLSYFVYGCHSRSSNQDFYFVQQYGVFNGSNAFTHNESKKRGRYLGAIEIDAWVERYQNRDEVGLIQSSPQTVNNTTSLTSSVEFSIGGEVGYDDGPTGGVSVGMTIGSSKTVDVRDCNTLNKSGDKGNNAHWRYEFKRVEKDTSGFGGTLLRNCLEAVPDLARNTFQPLNQWIWRVGSPRYASRKMTVQLKVELVETTMTWGITFTEVNHSVRKGVWAHTIRLPLPPL